MFFLLLSFRLKVKLWKLDGVKIVCFHIGWMQVIVFALIRVISALFLKDPWLQIKHIRYGDFVGPCLLGCHGSVCGQFAVWPT